MFDRTNNKRTKREGEKERRAAPPLYFSPSCSRRVVVRPAIYMQIRSKGELPVTKPSRFEFTSPPPSPPLPNTLSKSLRKRSRCRRKRRLILIFESSSSFTFRLKLRNRFSPSIHLRPSNWTSFHLRPSLESGLYTALFATVPLNFFSFLLWCNVP